MKKGLRIACKILSVFLSVLLVVQIAPMEIMANAYNEATTNENTENALDVPSDDIDETETEATIIVEETSKREENVKHFRMSDGSYKAAQYDVPVHFMLNGEWTDYDNTLTEVDADDEENENKLVKNKDLKNALADYTVRLSKKTNGKKFVRIEKDGYKLSWYYTNAKKSTAQIAEVVADDDDTTLEKLSSKVTYEDVYKNTDFEYIVSSNSLKENIILKKSNVQSTFEAEYKVNGLNPVQVDSHTINLVSEDNEIVYTISAPYMMDSNGEISTDVAIVLSNVKNNKFTVITTLDEEWLNDENRAYPVTVDPIIKTKQVAAQMSSAFVAASYPNRNYYTYGQQNGGVDSGSMYVGKISEYGQTESYVKFDLPTLGVADKVVNAIVRIYLIDCDNGLQVDVKRLLQTWDNQTVKWNNRPTNNTSWQNSPIIDYKVLEDGENPDWVNFEITDLVRGWYSGEYANYGISLTTEKTTDSKAYFLNSYFNENQQTKARPILYVDYRNMSGYEDYWSYTGLSAGRNGAVSVNNYNGNLVFTQPLTQGDGGNLMPVALSLVYNSNGKNAEYTYMAKNMQTNFHIYLREETREEVDDNYRYYLNDADGTIHWFYFEKNDDGSLKDTGKDEDGLGYTLDIIAKGSDSLCTYVSGTDYAKFRITDKDKNKMYFNCAGNLIQITNANGISATVQYETVENTMRMKSVTDGAGRVYTFQYHELYPHLCTGISDPASRVTSFEYWNGTMTRIIFPDAKSYYLTYYESNPLVYIGSIDGTQTRISYDSTGQRRVSNINWGTSDTSLLESYSFAYKQNETKVTDIQGRSYTYQFNDFGQNTGIVSNSDGAAQYFEYNNVGTNKADSRANKLISQSKVINTVTNYVINPGFTRDYSNGYWTYAPDTTGSPTVSIDTTKGNITKNSLKVYKPSTNTKNVTAVQNLSSVTPGTYTLSGYINTEGQTLAGGGAYLGVEFRNSSGTLVYTQRVEKIYKTDGWQRVSLTFTLPQDHTLTFVAGFEGFGNNAYGTVWFDDLQIEKGTGMSSYTMVENGGLTNGATAWRRDTLTSSNVVSGFNQALYLNGNPQEHWQGISQFIYPQNGKTGDVFSFGAWVKADSIPINDLKTGDSCIPEFYLAIHFYDANGLWKQTEKVKLNDDINTWQFVSGKAVAKQDYSKIMIDLVYYYNANTAYMTGAFCFREEFGQTYDYDDNGNVQSVVDLSNSKSSFAFKGNQMAKMLNPSGSEYFYTYAYNESDLTEAVSTDGQRYSFTYDDKGNVYTAMIEQDKSVLSVESGGKYIIRNAESGNVIDNGDNKGMVYNWRYRKWNTNQIWLLESTGETDVYYFKSLSYGGLYMGVKNNANTDNADIITASSPSGDAFKFKVHSNGDGTFRILTKSSNYTKCLDGQPNSSKEYKDESPLKQWTRISNDESQHWYFNPDITSASGAEQQDYISTYTTYTPSKNFVSTFYDQRGNSTTYNYDETKGTLTSVTDAKNNTTSYVYDNNTNALQSVTSGGMTNSYSYTNDRLTGINVNNGTRYKFLYDSFGRTTATQVGNGTNYRNLSTLEYNSAGLLSKQIYGNNDFISFTYDNLDRLTEKSYNNSSTDKVRYHYGTDGRLSQIIDFSTNSRMKYVYDLAGRVVSTREYDGANLTGINLKSSVNYTYADKTNYLTGVTHFSPLGTQNIGYRYGNMALGEMPDQIYGVTWNGNEKVSYTYDGLGRLTNKAINGVDTTYSYYDVAGVDNKTTTLLKSLSIFGVAHNYEYDELGNITSIEFNNSLANSYEYDDLNQLVRENNNDQGKTFTYEYVNGNIKYKHEYAYTTGDLPTTPKKTIEYHYEDSTWSDVLTKITETTYSSTNTSTASTYSLNGVNNNNSSSINPIIQSLLGDNYREVDLTANGILNTVGNDAPVVPSNSINTLAQSLLGDNYREVDLTANALVNVGDDDLGVLNMNTYSINSNSSTKTLYTFQSDEIGNITNIGNVTVDWNGRRLESISAGGTDLISYKYNIDGQRISKTYDGVTTEYFYNGDILAGQKKGDDVIVFMYDNNGDIFGFTYNGTPYYYVKNAQNDVWAIADELGELVVIYQYDAWGVVTACYDGTEENIASINPITYRSYYMDIELGFFMYYLNSRYYMADWGRFVSSDSVVAGVGGDQLGYNMFAYCNNNPIIGYDPYGTFDWSSFAKGVGRLVTGVTAIVAGAAVCIAGAPVTMLVVATITITAGALTTVNGAADIQQSITGKNFVRDTVFNGNQSSYDAYSGMVEATAVAGTAICGSYLKTNCTMKGHKAGSDSSIKLSPGQQLDRYGNSYGRYLTNPGTPIEQLALTPGNTGNLNSYIVTRSFTVKTGIVAGCEWGIGGGVQYFSWMSVERLVQFGYLTQVL